MDLTEKLGVDISRQVRIKLSADEDAKKVGDTVEHSIKFIISADWTINDLIDRLMISSSPKVAFQAAFRGKDTVPSEWKVNKAGTKAEVSVEALVDKLSDEAKKALFESLRVKFGDLL